MFGIVVLSESHVESLRPSESEAPLILGPAGEIFLVAEEDTVQKAHQAAGVLPHFATQLLESQELEDKCFGIQHFRMTNHIKLQ